MFWGGLGKASASLIERYELFLKHFPPPAPGWAICLHFIHFKVLVLRSGNNQIQIFSVLEVSNKGEKNLLTKCQPQ